MRKGWCPSLDAPMAAADGLLVRLHPVGGRLTAAEAVAIADAAGRFGNGRVELTNRGKVQVRGLSAASVAGFGRRMAAVGLAGEDLRVVASPLLGVDPAVCGETAAMVAGIVEVLAGVGEKFWVAVDGGGVLGLAGAGADIVVRAARSGWWVLVEGVGAASGDLAWVLGVVRALVDRVVGLGLGRVRELVGILGADRVCAEFGLIAGAGLPVRGVRPVGFVDVGGSGGVFGLGLAFGALNADGLRLLADLAEGFGDGRLILTPWRVVLLAGVAAGRVAELMAAAAGFVTDPEDAILGVAACVGLGGCEAATTETRRDAAWLGRRGVHVSGCAKGCAHPGVASVTLVGNLGRYDLVLAGRAGDAPAAFGLTREAVAARLREMV